MSNLINKHFLSSFLSEDANNLSDIITDLSIMEDLDFSTISQFINIIENSDISDEAKRYYLNRATLVYNESLDIRNNRTEDIINEYAGNPYYNKLLITLMKEMEAKLNEYFDDTKIGIKALDEIAEILKSESKKKSPDAKQAGIRINSVYKRIDKEFTEGDTRKKAFFNTYDKLRNTCNRFGIKFSDVAMIYKKEFDKKLQAAYNKMDDDAGCNRWLPDRANGITPAIKDVNECLDILALDNKDAVITIVQRYLQPTYNYMYNCMCNYFAVINSLRRALGLEKEDTAFYKFINWAFKTSKEN